MKLFYELIRVSIGTADKLSHRPSAEEWDMLYGFAMKQSLVGVCFNGVHTLCDSHATDYCGMTEEQYFTWLGATASIQQRNDIVNKQCIELQSKFSADGMSSVILKGPGVGQLYGSLARFRQSGDIDVWISGSREKTLAYVQNISPTNIVTKLHVQLRVFEDTSVEVHFMPTYMRCPWLNKRLQKWFKKYDGFNSFGVNDGIKTPSVEFNLVFLLLHIFRHLLGEGIGLRQVMDYYYVLLQPQGFFCSSGKLDETVKLLKEIHLFRFASGLMWVMQEVFGLECKCMLCKPDEKLGRLILREIEISGNFGQQDERMKEGETLWKRFFRTNASNLRFMWYFPEEVLCTPFYRVWHKCWQKVHGYCG